MILFKSLTQTKLVLTLTVAVMILSSCMCESTPTPEQFAAPGPTGTPTCVLKFTDPQSLEQLYGQGTYRFKWTTQPGAALYVLSINGQDDDIAFEPFADVTLDAFQNEGPFTATVMALKDQNTILCTDTLEFKVNVGAPKCELAWVNPAPGIVNIPNLSIKFDWTDQPGAALYGIIITTPGGETIDYAALDSNKIIGLENFTEPGFYTIRLLAGSKDNKVICEIERQIYILPTKKDEGKKDQNEDEEPQDFNSPPEVIETPIIPG
jgi:hypothetical protein